MADKTIKINIQTDANSSLKSIEDLKLELRDLETKFETAKFGTEKFKELGAQVKAARNGLKDIDAQFEGLDKEQRATALVDTFTGLVGAVGAVSSAFIAFGADAEAIEGAEKKLLGIVGVVGGLRDAYNGLVAAGKLFGPTFAAVGESIKAGFAAGTASVRAFNIALTGVGIGVVILAVNELSKAFENNKKAQEDAAAEAELNVKRLDNVEKKKLNTIIENNKKQLRSDLETASERGASDLELVQIKLDSQKKLTNDLDEFRNNSNSITSAFIDEQNKLTNASADAEIEIQNNKNAVLRAQRAKDAAEAKALAKEKAGFLLDIENDLREALQQLAIDQAATERQRAQIEYNNTLEDLKVAETAELAEAERLGVSNINIIAKYAALEKDTKIKLNNDLATIDKAASEKLIADRKQQLESQLSLVETQYSRTLNNIENTATQIALTQNVATKEQFDEIYGFIAQAINDTKAALEKENLDIATSIRNRVNITVALLEEEQLKRQKILQQQTDDAIRNNGIFSAEAVNAQNKQAEDFQAFQDKKLQIITNGSKALLAVDNSTTEQQAQNQQELQDLVLGTAKSLFGDLSTLNQIFASDSEAAAKKSFDQQKNFATATAIIDTYLSAQKAFTSQIIPGDPSSIFRGQIAAAIAVAAGLGRVAVIRAQKFNGGGSTGGGTAGGSTGSSNGGGSNLLNPFSNEEGGTNVLPPRLAPPSGGGTRGGTAEQFNPSTGGQIPIFKTYVLAGDVTDAQVANEKINQKRKF